MNHKEFVATMSKDLGKNNADTEAMVNTLVMAMSQNLEEGDTVRIPEFGKFEAKKHYERVIVNPETGVRKLVPPRVSVAFTPAFTVRDQSSKEEV